MQSTTCFQPAWFLQQKCIDKQWSNLPCFSREKRQTYRIGSITYYLSVKSMKVFHCKQCGSCCTVISGLFEVSKQGDLLRLYQYVREHLLGLLWGKVRVQTFSEFLYYVRDFTSACEQLGKQNLGCPFLVREGSRATCIVHTQKPVGCKVFPTSRTKAYELTLDCKGWD